jgi:hypothetical protein
MTSKASNGTNGKKPTVIVFGRDAEDKPRAGVFIGKTADAVRQTVGKLPVRLLEATTPDSQTLAGKTPPGRVQADGQPFLPYVPRDLYDQIATLADAMAVLAAPLAPTDQPPGAAAPAPGLPATFDAIGIGHLVIAQDDYAEDGWWEATVINRTNDMLTLRWRDYPRFKPFTRHLAAVALLNPSHK